MGQARAAGFDRRLRDVALHAAKNVNGRDFYVGGDEVAMLSPPEFDSTLFHEGGWTVDALDRFAPAMTGGLTDPFLFPNPFTNDD